MIIEISTLIIIIFVSWCWLKLVSYLMYVWQNYEYRIDRITVYIRSKRFRYDLWNVFNPLDWWLVRRPKLTLKIVTGIGLTLYFCLLVFGKMFKPLALLLMVNHFFLYAIICNLLLIIILTPGINLVVMIIVNIPSLLIKQFIIFKAKKRRQLFPRLIVIGITGSYGKSSTKEILAWLLKTQYRLVKTDGTINTEIGVAQTILKNLTVDTEILLVEMGAYKQGEITKICNLVRPQIGIITGINEQHAALFGTINKIMETKYELIRALPKNGLAVFNTSNRLVKQLFDQTNQVSKIAYRKPTVPFKSNLTISFLQENIAGAVKVAQHLKIDKRKIAKALLAIPANRHFMPIRKGINQSVVYDNSYNTNPHSFMASLALLNHIHKDKLVIVTPGIIELGDDEYRIHRSLAIAISRVSRSVILTNRNFCHIFQQELAPSVKLSVASNTIDLTQLIPVKSTILLEGRIPPWLYQKIVISAGKAG